MLNRTRREAREVLAHQVDEAKAVASLDPAASPERAGRVQNARPLRAGLRAKAAGPIDLEPLRAWIDNQSAARIAKLVKKGEAEIDKLAEEPVNLKWAKPGDEIRMPASQLRPGQSQISFDRAREQLSKFFNRLNGHTPEDVRTLAEALGLLEVPGIVTADARTVVLPDRNHTFTALLALKGWLTDSTQGLRWHRDPTLVALHKVFLGPDAHVKVHIEQSLAGEDEAVAESQLRSQGYYQNRDGTAAALGVRRFSELEDNPYRGLVTAGRIKVVPGDEGKRDFELKGKQLPIWLKDPTAPDFVEFYIAEVFATALVAAGRPYDGCRALSDEDAVLLRDALRRVQADPEHPRHEVLSKILVVPEHLTNEHKLKDALRVGRKKGRVKLSKEHRD